MTRLSPEFENLLGKYSKHKIDTYKVLELLGNDYVFNDLGADTTDKRYTALVNCGTFLGFSKEVTPEGKIYHLRKSNFCRQRLCPMCQFRRSERMYANMLRVVKHLEGNYRFIHMVLTIPNPRTERELVTGVKLLYGAFGRLIRKERPKKAFKGILRCLEVSFNYSENSFHPHLHCLVAVRQSYFNDNLLYISTERLREYWTEAVAATVAALGPSADFARSEHILQCSITACREGDYSGVAEVCKYCVKPLDLDKTENDDKNKRVILSLWHTLKGTRFVQKYGIIREAFRELRLSDDEPEGEQSEGDELVYFTWDSRTLSYGGE